MPTQDASNIKEKIMSIIRQKGPSLPVHVASGTGLSILFSSAFLSELLSEKKIKMSNMRVGSSPLYFIPGQEPSLERYSQHLKSKEKDAFSLLKEKKFLKDIKQDPAIRVALRSIQDFAIPFKKEDEIYWRYFTSKEEEFELKEKPKLEVKEEKIQIGLKEENEELKEQPKLETKEEVPIKQELDIFDESIKKKITKRKINKKRTDKNTQSNKLFEKIKEFLSSRSIEILNIESFSKNDVVLKVKKEGREKILIAYNKKRLNEQDIIKAHKKALEFNLPYIVMSTGEPLKKLQNLIDALENLEDIQKIQD